jgi:hypothetical protein
VFFTEVFADQLLDENDSAIVLSGLPFGERKEQRCIAP